APRQGPRGRGRKWLFSVSNGSRHSLHSTSRRTIRRGGLRKPRRSSAQPRPTVLGRKRRSSSLFSTKTPIHIWSRPAPSRNAKVVCPLRRPISKRLRSRARSGGGGGHRRGL